MKIQVEIDCEDYRCKNCSFLHVENSQVKCIAYKSLISVSIEKGKLYFGRCQECLIAEVKEK